MGSKVSVSNKDETDVPFQIFRMAWANIGAVGTILMFEAFATGSVAWIESVMTSDFITELLIRSTAGPESTPCVM